MGLKFFLQWIILGLIGSMFLTARDNLENKATILKTLYFVLWLTTLAFVIISVALAPEGDRLIVGFLHSIFFLMLLRVVRKRAEKSLRK